MLTTTLEWSECPHLRDREGWRAVQGHSWAPSPRALCSGTCDALAGRAVEGVEIGLRSLGPQIVTGKKDTSGAWRAEEEAEGV